MKKKTYLNKLNNINSILVLVNYIKSIFTDIKDQDYMPAIVEEGSFTLEQGEDLYIKLVLKHQSIKLENTWLVDNMALNLEEPTDYRNEINNSAFCHNVITYRKYKSRNLYQLNPLLVSDEINEYEYTNSNHVNAYLNNEYSNLKGQSVLKSTRDIKLMILKKVFKPFINEPHSNKYPKFELVAEFEYRTHNFGFEVVQESIYKSSDYFLRVDKGKDALYILGSVIIPPFESKNEGFKRNITVLDLNNLHPREHNSNHFNGDTIEGFVCFKPEVISILKEYFYFYDLQLVDKNNNDNTYLVDVLGDKVVFWEAEYNKLPDYIKNKIDFFNFVPNNKNKIISPAMSAMQLEVDWNWDRKLTPEYMLANLIREKAFKRAIDAGLSFTEPQNKDELKDFILKIEFLTNVSLEMFNSSSDDVKQLINIRNGSNISSPVEDLKLLYLKYCYAVQMEYKNDIY